MKGLKYPKTMKPQWTWSWKGVIRGRRNGTGGLSTKLDYSALTLIMLAGMLGLITMMCRMACSEAPETETPDSWDEQRTMWLDQHPNLRPPEDQRPRILMVTGSSPEPCESADLNHRILQSAKNKLDYCRLHSIPLYYSLGSPDPQPGFTARSRGDWWATLPAIRMLMLQHPEVEWMWWVDADSVFTDLSLEPPFADLKEHNLVLFRESPKVKTGIHTGNYLIRNCQWTLDLIRLREYASSNMADNYLSSASLESHLAAAEKLHNAFDARKSMVTSLLHSPQKVGHKVIETNHWMAVAPNLEDLEVKLQQAQNHSELPLVTHFAGCIPCSTEHPLSSTEQQQLSEDICLQQLDRIFDFADNQIYHRYGFQRRALGSSKMESLTTDEPTEDMDAADHAGAKEFSMLPRITVWDELRYAHMAKSWLAGKNNKVLLVSGSSSRPCERAVGDQTLVRGLKNKLDYCRLHGIEFFYNMVAIDKELTGWWSKLPLLRMLMLKNPDVEWMWWMDSDAVVTDIDFEIPFESRYNAHSGYNLVIYGDENLLLEKRYTAINTGSFFIRNCQWSIDLLDTWASYGNSEESRKENGEFLSNFLKGRPTFEADDQAALVYILIAEGKKWSSKVLLEHTDVDMSGDWEYWTPRFADDVPSTYKPFVTHFAGCEPCGSNVSQTCLTQMDRTFHFADNQVLESAGLCHEHLGSADIVSSCSIRAKALRPRRRDFQVHRLSQ